MRYRLCWKVKYAESPYRYGDWHDTRHAPDAWCEELNTKYTYIDHWVQEESQCT